MNRIAVLAGLAVIGIGTLATAQDGYLSRGKQARWDRTSDYQEAIRRTAEMVNDPEARRLAEQQGLDVVNLTWEDTGRYKNSSVGPNISDMTIQVAADRQGQGYDVKCMPVIRFPNYSDRTADVDPENFTLLVGNEKGRGLQRVSLYEFLEHPDDFLHSPNSWPGRDHSLLAERDDHILTSAQACFLPVPRNRKATFNPVLFNYQSTRDNPAVLTILATREGASVTVIDNQRDAFREGSAWGQRLFHNANGMRASLTGERESDFGRRQGDIGPGQDPGRWPRREEARQANMNMVLLIQVPLKQRYVRPRMEADSPTSSTAAKAGLRSKGSDVENAVIGHGALEGPFTEIGGIPIERDERFPIRATVQFYKATSNGVVSDEDLQAIHDNLEWVYDHGDAVGSIVTEGETGRSTEYWGMKVQPRGWWERFWDRYERDQGISRQQAQWRLQRLLGRDYMDEPVCELYLRDRLRKGATR